MPQTAIYAVKRNNQTCQSHGFIDSVEIETLNLLPYRIQLSRVVYLPRLLMPVLLYGGASVSLPAIMFREPAIEGPDRIEMINKRLIDCTLFLVQEVACAKNLRPHGNIIAYHGVAEFCEGLGHPGCASESIQYRFGLNLPYKTQYVRQNL